MSEGEFDVEADARASYARRMGHDRPASERAARGLQSEVVDQDRVVARLRLPILVRTLYLLSEGLRATYGAGLVVLATEDGWLTVALPADQQREVDGDGDLIE